MLHGAREIKIKPFPHFPLPLSLLSLPGHNRKSEYNSPEVQIIKARPASQNRVEKCFGVGGTESQRKSPSW
jgi:hypothetical protein